MPALASAVTAGVLFGASLVGARELGGAVLVLQLLMTLAWLAVVDAPGGTGALLLAGAAAAAGDAMLVRHPADGIGVLVAVVGVSLVAGIGHQLLRRSRVQVTRSLAGSVSAVLLAMAAATLVGLRVGPDGGGALAATVAGAGAALVAARLVDAVLSRPRAVPGGRRGWPGLLGGAAAAFAAGLAVARYPAGLPARPAWELALIAGGVALAVELVFDAGAVSLLAGDDERRAAAVAPALALLPLALAAPAAYVAARILLT